MKNGDFASLVTNELKSQSRDDGLWQSNDGANPGMFESDDDDVKIFNSDDELISPLSSLNMYDDVDLSKLALDSDDSHEIRIGLNQFKLDDSHDKPVVFESYGDVNLVKPVLFELFGNVQELMIVAYGFISKEYPFDLERLSHYPFPESLRKISIKGQWLKDASTDAFIGQGGAAELKGEEPARARVCALSTFFLKYFVHVHRFHMTSMCRHVVCSPAK